MKCSDRKITTYKWGWISKIKETREDFMPCLGQECNSYVDKEKSGTGKPVCLKGQLL